MRQEVKQDDKSQMAGGDVCAGAMLAQFGTARAALPYSRPEVAAIGPCNTKVWLSSRKFQEKGNEFGKLCCTFEAG